MGINRIYVNHPKRYSIWIKFEVLNHSIKTPHADSCDNFFENEDCYTKSSDTMAKESNINSIYP